MCSLIEASLIEASLIEASLIEASFINRVPSYDISYMQGFTTPVSCLYEGKVVTNCNMPLFNDNGAAGAVVGGGPICYNLLENSPQGQSMPAAPFFEPCQRVALAYPNDHSAMAGYAENTINCCVGNTCPPNPNQKHTAQKAGLEDM